MNNTALISTNLATLLLIMITLLAIGACFFLIGYLYGSKRNLGVYNSIPTKINTIIATNNLQKNNPIIEIDNTKIVTKIKTDDMEKKYSSLGEKKETEDNIESSINKLKNIKR